MQLQTILNRVARNKSFVYGSPRWVEDGPRLSIEVPIAPRGELNGTGIFFFGGRAMTSKVYHNVATGTRHSPLRERWEVEVIPSPIRFTGASAARCAPATPPGQKGVNGVEWHPIPLRGRGAALLFARNPGMELGAALS